MTDFQSPTHQPVQSALGIFLRISWMVLGNVILAVCALVIFQSKGIALSIADVVYWITPPLIIVARYLDVTQCKGTTAYGEPATLKHWLRHTILLVCVTAGVWLAGHSMAYWRAM